MKFIFQESTQTIRTTPENYLVAWRNVPSSNHWVCDIDLAIPDRIAASCFIIIRVYSYKGVNRTIKELNEEQSK